MKASTHVIVRALKAYIEECEARENKARTCAVLGSVIETKTHEEWIREAKLYAREARLAARSLDGLTTLMTPDAEVES